MGRDIKFYFSIFMRRFHYFAAVAVIVAAASVATAILLPTRYYSEAILLVESPQIPDELASSTVRTNPQEQLEIMEQRLLTRANLLEIANEFDVFSDRSRMFPDEIVEEMRLSTKTQISTGRDRASLFVIGFTADRPETSAQVANDYVTRVLESNVVLRTGRAEGTLDFFEQEIQRLGENLATKSAEILEFKNENIDALPENLDYALSRVDDLRDRLVDANRTISALGEQRERLILVFNATGGSAAGGQDLRSPKQKELDGLREQLTEALTVYSETNPRVKSLRARIASLEETVDREGPSTGGQQLSAQSILDLQLAELDGRRERVEAERIEMLNEIEALEEGIAKTQGNAVILDNLTREYEIIEGQYNSAVERGAIAATGERIELLSKGERISVISPPVAPREPSSPNRPLIAIGGSVLGVLLGLATVALIEFLRGHVRRSADITKALGIMPLATIPRIRTPGETVRRRATILASLAILSTITVGGIYYTHTQIAPIDLLADRAMSRLGL